MASDLVRVLTVMCVVALVAACVGTFGPPAPSSSPGSTAIEPEPPLAGPPIACYGAPVEQCAEVADVAVTAIAGHPPITWVEVGPPPCENEPCPQALLPGQDLTVWVHFVGAAPRWVTVAAEVDGLAVNDAGIGELIELEPTSPPGAPLGAHPFSLGHCGIYSQIDFDGSFWDPVGRVDFTASAAINSAAGTLVLLTATTARFIAPPGFVLDLVRHPGAKHFQGCA